MELSDWFKGFEKGIARLSSEQRAAFFSECSKNCVNGGTLSIYKKLYEDANGDMDVFFQIANELPGVKGEVVETGRVYHLTFLECTCNLCKKGYVTTPLLCECSRQSVIYSMQSLWKKQKFKITLCHSILQGKQDCKIKIEVIQNGIRTEHFMKQTKEEWEADQMRILPVMNDKKLYLPLLLLGDEQESMIDRYLERGEMLVMQNRTATSVAVAVVTDEGSGVLELKNLAVHPLFQRKGYGRKMIAYVCGHYKDRFHTLLAGTGDSRQTISFYKNCGFTYSHTVADFFLNNYDHPIVEDGKALKDMIYFKRKI